jgi:energy-coupling factor transport system permease protein
VLAGTMAAVLDLVYWYPLWSGGWKLTYVVLVVASTAVVSGLGGRALVRALARTGALSSFTAGRSRV